MGLTLNNFFLNLLNYYVSMPMEKKGQYARLSAISQVRRTCSASVHVTTGHRECQGPVWSPGGQLPYEYIKKKKEKKRGGTYMGVACRSLTKPPPPHCPAESG